MKQPLPFPPQNFDDWARLAATDRDTFEAQRKRLIDHAIAQAPVRNRHRLRCLQWKLDQIRATSRTPMLACLRMNRLLWEALAGESGLLERLNRTAHAHQAPARKAGDAAQVIPLTPRP
jgi:hypothetical protein